MLQCLAVSSNLFTSQSSTRPPNALGGWLTQFFPDAEAEAPGVKANQFGPLTAETTGRLTWSDLRINGRGEPPETTEPVWLAPRKVEAQMVATPKGEAEKFLFYRGVGHLEAPLTVRRVADKLEIGRREGAVPIGRLWLVDICGDGTAAYRVLDQTGAEPLTTLSAFSEEAYSADAAGRLRESLRTALVADGLFADEAEALLETWKLSYFESAGLRVFFLVPRAWTDRYLPLAITGDPPTVRTMVGRIELVTPAQRHLLAEIAAGPVPDSWKDLRQPTDAVTWRAGDQKALGDLLAGRRTFASLGVRIPKTYQRYLDLGRFRNALALDELARRPTPELAGFIEKFHLTAYRPRL